LRLAISGFSAAAPDAYGHAADLLEADEATATDWRGSIPWGRPYESVLREWQARDPLARPPAFQDGQARPEQLLPGTPGHMGAISGHTGAPITDPEGWVYCLVRSGRGWGKTLLGAQAIIEWARQGIGPMLIAGRTAADVRDTMVEFGPSAILRVSPPDFTPHYEPTKRRLTFPNGVEVATRSADEPDGFRGVQFVRAWLDELAAWNYLAYAWEQIKLVMRVKRRERVQVVITTTPRPVKVIKDLTVDHRTALVVRPSHDNLSNLADDFAETIRELEGTRAGRQEVYGEITEDAEGALWTQSLIDEDRITRQEFERRCAADELRLVRVAEGVDPPGGERTECGIVVMAKGDDRHAYVLRDLSLRGGADVWPAEVIAGYRGEDCDLIVAEVNFGGDMVEKVIQGSGERRMPVKVVRASRGKAVRAEPVAMLYRRHLVHHVGNLPDLEREMTGWVPDHGMPSPNRLDASVWTAVELFGLYDAKEKPRARMPKGAETLLPVAASGGWSQDVLAKRGPATTNGSVPMVAAARGRRR
jgi:phage terminase large subunit-like protein